MLVVAKYQLGYKGNLILGGDTFELEDKDYLNYRNDVIVLPDPLAGIGFKPISVKELKKEVNKQLKKRKVKTK